MNYEKQNVLRTQLDWTKSQRITPNMVKGRKTLPRRS